MIRLCNTQRHNTHINVFNNYIFLTKYVIILLHLLKKRRTIFLEAFV